MDDRAAPGATGGGKGEEFDREIDVRAILGFGIGLAVVMTLVLALVWVMIGALRSRRAALDPPPSAMVLQQASRQPPGPRLQSDPAQEMEAMRRADEETLRSYAWIDRGAGIARIPIDRAIDIVSRTGLPASPPAPSSMEPGADRRAPGKERHRRRRP
jgi:hypothetical protein